MTATPYREAGTVDETEIALEKIRQEGETRREAIRNRDTAGYLLPKFFAALIASGVILAAAILANSYLESRYPKPSTCEESSRIISKGDDAKSCPAGARMETEPVAAASAILVRCVCGPHASR